ncbi:hypothetical protein FA15DRAFT_624886 [Coprinopsis marcescibilis]|uniref:SEC7 domain-containing protein n=1 Tax=Coprinopsis marcescibilis TaxID=230819 RepID=A0A5C3KKR4_COPMA|nr:hypothetical protein FA15DRAFT_624886 [Coprinopsis marcescibilis]
MAEPESHVSRAEQRAFAVAKLKRAASLPRMKDGRRPPMNPDALSEAEKSIPPTPTPPDFDSRTPEHQPTPEPTPIEHSPQQAAQEYQEKKVEDNENQQLQDSHAIEVDAEADAETDDRSFSPGPTRSRRRPRSRSRSRNSKDFKGRNRGAPSPTPNNAGDSSPDEAPPMPITLPILPPLFTPIPSPYGLHPSRFLPSPDPSIFYGVPSSPPTPLPLPTLEALQKGLMRSNSAGNTAASRRLAMAKLTGGTDTYEPSPSPTPPPVPGSRLNRNNTVAGGERIAARQLMLGRLAGRVAKETDTEQQVSGEERGAPSPTPSKRRRRRSRRNSSSAANAAAVHDSDPSSTPNTPFYPPMHAASSDHFSDLRAQSATPNQASSSRNQSNERIADAVYANGRAENGHEPQEPRRRSVVIEDDEDDEERYPIARSRTPAITPPPHRASPYPQIPVFRTIHSSDSPESHSSDSVPGVNGGAGTGTIPVYLGRGSPARHDRFPSSPFPTPLKERQPLSDDDEEQVLYPADTLRPRTPASAQVPISDTSRPRTPYGTDRDAFDREISWVASPVPEINLPIDDDDGEEEDDEEDEDGGAEVPVQDNRYQEYDEPLSPTSVNGFSQSNVYNDASPRISASTSSIVVESEASADINHQQFAAIPLSQSASYSQQNGERSHITGDGYADWEERLLNREVTKQRSAEGSSPSAWEKVKSTFSRSTSSAGRRSRSNSIINRERNSSISRESGASLTFTATTTSQPVAPPLMQSPSASASILSLSPHSHMRGNPSPIPLMSDADRSKYQNDKLFPFPGMKRLEEQRKRGAFPVASASTPDVSMLASSEEQTAQPFSSTPQTPAEHYRERKLSRQASDPRLNTMLNQEHAAVSPVRQEYIDLAPLNVSANTGSSKAKLPMTFTDVKHWLSNYKGKKGSPSIVPAPTSVALSPSLESQLSVDSKFKSPFTEMFRTNNLDSGSEWEDKSTPTVTHPASPQNQTVNIRDYRRNGRTTPATNGASTDTERTPKAKKIVPLNIPLDDEATYRYQIFQEIPGEKPKPERQLFTPDPASSMSEFPAPSASDSSSTTSSQYSLGPTPQALALLQKLDDTLARGSVPVDEMPRKLLFSSPVLQVVNPNTVKDRFLFLFTDILVIAKPMLQESGALMDNSSVIPPDRKYIVKSVVRFRDLRFCQDRVEPLPKSATPSLLPRSPFLRSFVAQFAKDPEQAVNELLSRSKIDDSSVVGQVLFKTQELDRSRLGDYLCRRSSKSMLKAYLDNFGFLGLRIDNALRIFLHSIHIPQIQGVLEYLLDSFASRWYEANAKSVAYDRDMAIRLVRAIAQLNELLHGNIADEVGQTGPIRREITVKDFCDAFRRYDPRRLVSDELLDDVYTSIRTERLSQARAQASHGSPDIVISFKRPLPTRLTYKIQSDPVIIRLPQADPSLTLHLFGQDLVFEPPVLNFAKSPEASFRVTGTSLGSKSLVIRRSGPNAIKYAGVPLSYTIPVERAFMRNTFQVAFFNHTKAKRRYMFSVDDHLLRHQWAQSIRQQIEKSLATPPAGSENPIPGASDFFRAAEEVAFKVLQETLMGRLTKQQDSPSPPATDQNGHGSGYLVADRDVSNQASTAHRRSKSRSKLYPHQGAGRLEFDLHKSHHYHTSHDSNDTTDCDDNLGPYDQSGKLEGKVWTGREITLQCQQNSLIPAVLSYLQLGTGTS